MPPPLLSRARELFTLALDSPGGMKIQTIHGFCQSILARFPLEAGIPPHFRILDDIQAEEILIDAQRRVFSKPTLLGEQSLSILNPYMADQRFSSVLGDFYQERVKIVNLLGGYPDFWSFASELIDFLEVDAFVEEPQQLLDINVIERLKAKITPKDCDFEAYVATYLTQKMEIRKKLPQEQIVEAERVFRFVRALSALEVARRTVATLILLDEILAQYQDRKTRLCGLDYDDLIQKTLDLLKQPGIAAWVLYKLDGGIDHLLIDEAQDTNAAQWEIIVNLTSEFFTQDKAYRTIFAVGDAKQSIYSFQGANPEDFIKLKEHFSNMSRKVGQVWRDVKLDLSYRSTAAILSIVDEVFAQEKNKKGVSFEGAEITHQVFRKNCQEHLPGLVELWPLFEPEIDEDDNGGEWSLPLERVKRSSPQSRLADHLADQVSEWIASGGVLPSTHKPIQPRDIIVLARKRSTLGHEIIKALKKRNIPVAGADRLMLTDHIAVMDLLALGQFTLLPEDDLNLACILRSPLIGMSEEDLFILAYRREGTLWSSLTRKINESAEFEEAYHWLRSCLREADLSPVYEFYSWVLTQNEGRRRLLSRLGHEAEDAIEEFLTRCLNFDKDHTSSLQGFVNFMNQQHQEIKRDTSDAVHNQVRLMTVHGSKGLQAPIVILPDAADSGRGKADPLLWGDSLVMLRPTQAQDTDKTRHLKNRAAEAELEEKRRLLYVALTRAQDRLYVGGWTSGKEISPDCWYQVIKDALNLKNGTHFYQSGEHRPDKLGKSDLGEPTDGVAISLPDWARNPLKEVVKEKGESREKKAPTTAAIERGILIHRFFEFLPQISLEERYKAAHQMIEKEGLNRAEWEKDIETTLQILEDPNFREIFGPNSLAEVPITGTVEGVPFQGRIDRLHVTAETLTIIDYKSNQDVPTCVEEIPEVYVKQLEGYAKALRSIYPDHEIRKILLWTEGPMIQVVE